MATDEVIKIDKFVKNVNLLHEEEDDDYSDITDENVRDEYDIQNDSNDNFEDIYNDIVEFVKDTSLPLCEHLTLNKLNNFILKEVLFS